MLSASRTEPLLYRKFVLGLEFIESTFPFLCSWKCMIPSFILSPHFVLLSRSLTGCPYFHSLVNSVGSLGKKDGRNIYHYNVHRTC